MASGILEQDHEQLSTLLQQLQSSLLQHAADHTFELLDLFWARLAMHIRAENLCFFPAILNASRELFDNGGGVPSLEEARTMIEDLRTDHNFFMDELSKAVKLYREIMDQDERQSQVSDPLAKIRERVNAVSLRLESHNLIEEKQVYTWPSLLLKAWELECLGIAVRRELENLPRRFSRR